MGLRPPLQRITAIRPLPTFDSNVAGGNGGAISLGSGALVVSQSTFQLNSAERGGAIYADTGALTLLQSTVEFSNGLSQSATFPDSGIYSNSAPLTIRNSIIARGTNLSDLRLSPDAGDAFVMEFSFLGRSTGTNLTPTGTTTPDANGNLIGDANGIDPMTGALEDYGGPTKTIAPLAGSPVINRGSNALAAAFTSDQRGAPFVRVSGGTVDMGAFEVQPVTLVVDTAVDEDDGDYSAGDLSLREAIRIANANRGSDTVTFAPSTNGNDFKLSLGLLLVSDTLTITGNGATSTIIDAQQLSRIFEVDGKLLNPDFTISGVTLVNGKTTGGNDHAAIQTFSTGLLTVLDSVLTGNFGGAIGHQGSVSVTRSIISGNTGAVPFSTNDGVAITAGGAITVLQSTLSGNTGGALGGAIRGGAGGVNVIQSTIAGNSAFQGGAIYTTTGGVNVIQSTIAGNTATGFSPGYAAVGGGIHSESAAVSVSNSIVAGNFDDGTAPDIYKPVGNTAPFAVQFSLIGKNTGNGLIATAPNTPDGNGNLIGGAAGIDPKLGPLANNGGPTQTMALLAGSPAFNRGSNAIAASFAFDQRGTPFARVVSGTADVGAFESPPQTDLQITKTAPATTVSGQDLTYTITIANVSLGDAQTVLAADALPAGTTFVSLIQNGGPSFNATTPSVGSGGNVVLDTSTFAAGAVATFTLVVNVAVSTSGAVTNSAQVTTTTLEADPSNNASTVTTVALIPDDLQIYKTALATVDPGANLTYTVTVSNTGPGSSDVVVVADPIPTGTTFVSLSQTSGPTFNATTPSVGGTGNVVLDIATLAAGETATFTLVVLVDSGLTGGSIDNTAQVTSITPDVNMANNSSMTSTAITQADVTVTKNGPATVFAGEDLVYTITFSNAGPDPATNLVVSDSVPTGTTFVSLTQNSGGAGFTTSTPGFGNNGTVTISTPSLAPGTVATYTLVVRVPAGQTTGFISNTATATSLTPDTNTADNTSNVVTNITTQTDLAVTKTGPATVVAGQDATYTLTVGNHGPSFALDVLVLDALPPGTTFVSLTQTSGPMFMTSTPAVGANGTVTLTLDSLPNFAGAEFTLVVHVGSGIAGTLANTATGTTSTPEGLPGDNTATAITTVTTAADLQVTKTAAATVVAGDNLTYTITVSNAGPSDAQVVSITDVLPAGTTFVSVTQTAGPAFTVTSPSIGSGGSLTLDAGTLAAGATATFTLVVAVDPLASGTLTNTATGTTTTSDATPGNDASTATTTVDALGDLTVAVTADKAAAFPGDVVTFTVVVTNLGHGTSPGALVSVPFAADLGSVAWTAAFAGGATGAATGTGDISELVDLPAGATVTYTVTAVVLAGRRATIPTVAQVTAGSKADPDAGNNSATAGVVRAPEIEVVSVGAGGASHVKVFATLDGRLLHSFFAYPGFGGGASVAQGDVNGDGVNDVVTGAGAGGAPHVKVFDGLTGAEIASFYAYDSSFRDGVYVAAGDVDGDGRADIVTGAGVGGAPHVKVFSGPRLTETASFFAYDSSFRGGVQVAAGDVDGDGRADIVTGAGPGGAPHVKVFSGPRLAETASFLAYREAFSGGVFVAVGDINGDGVPDIVTGAGPSGGPRVRAFAADGGAESLSFFDTSVGFAGGVRVAVSDYDGDGVDDLLVGTGPGGAPLVKRYRGGPALSGSAADVVEAFAPFDAAFLGGVFVG